MDEMSVQCTPLQFSKTQFTFHYVSKKSHWHTLVMLPFFLEAAPTCTFKCGGCHKCDPKLHLCHAVTLCCFSATPTAASNCWQSLSVLPQQNHVPPAKIFQRRLQVKLLTAQKKEVGGKRQRRATKRRVE